MRPGGRFNGVVGLIRTGAVIHQGLAGGLAGVMEAFYVRTQGLADLDWVPPEMLRNAVDAAVLIAYQLEELSPALSDFLTTHTMFGEDQVRSSRCLTGAKAPLCIDLLCWGDDDGKCSLDPRKGFDCLRTMELIEDGWDDNTWFDTQQDFLNGLGFPEGPPSAGPQPACNGDAAIHWTSNAAASAAIDLFCGDSQNLKSSPGQVTWQEYNPGTADDMVLTIATPKDAQGDYTMSKDTCTNYFKLIINTCDNNDPQNPENVQHGGAMPHTSGAIFTIDPRVGEPKSSCYELGTKTWVDAANLTASQEQFCSSINLHTKRTGAGSTTSNLGIYINAVTFRLDYPENANINPAECNKMFDLINAGCDGNDTVKNPLNFKHGGSVSFGGTTYTIGPTVDRTNPPLLTYGWNWQLNAEVVTNGTTGINGAPIDKGDLQVCLDKFAHKGWGKFDCGNMHWDLNGYHSWASGNGCHMACVNSLSRAINGGANFAICDMKHKSAHCLEIMYPGKKESAKKREVRDEI